MILAFIARRRNVLPLAVPNRQPTSQEMNAHREGLALRRARRGSASYHALSPSSSLAERSATHRPAVRQRRWLAFIAVSLPPAPGQLPWSNRPGVAAHPEISGDGTTCHIPSWTFHLHVSHGTRDAGLNEGGAGHRRSLSVAPDRSRCRRPSCGRRTRSNQ